MKKYLLFLFAAVSLHGETLPDLTTFEDANKKFDRSVVFEETFDRPLEGWKWNSRVIREAFKILPNQGVNGTPCLFYERNDPQEYFFMSKPIKLKSNMEYVCSFKFRTENIDVRDTNQKAFKDQVSLIGIQYRADKRWVGISPTYAKHKELKPGEWQTWSFPILQPAGTGMEASFDIYLRQGLTGRMWIDDIAVRPVGMTSALLYPVASGMKLGKDGIIQIRAAQLGDRRPVGDLALMVESGGRKKLFRTGDGVLFTGSIGSFPVGKVPVKVWLLDLKSKLILAQDRYIYNVPGAAPKGEATIDAHQRLIVDGKPYMPLAVFSGFTHPPTREILVRLKKAGFNSMMYYHPMKYLFIDGRKKTHREDMLSSLDALHELDMKLIFALFRQNIPKQPGVRETLDGVHGLHEVTGYVVNTVKNHPSILAYYISDENPLSEYPSVKALRERISAIDPHHPTVTLTNREDYFDACAATGDIISYDYYPINTGRDQSFHFDGIAAAGRLGVPHWFTPQAFNWGIYRTHHKYESYRYPTAEEMRAMNLAAVIHNARGFMFYSFAGILNQEKKDPAYAGKFWDAISHTAQALRHLEPWIMSIEKAPQVTVKKLDDAKAEVQARAFSAQKRIAVVIVSGGPGKVRAEVTVPGRTNLESRYGHTRNLGGGKYLFVGENISSDVLE